MNIKRWIDHVLSKSVFTQACLWVALVSFVFNLLAQTEHNRWNIKKLLMDYRATTPEEAEKITTGTYDRNTAMETLKVIKNLEYKFEK
jgi:hypothetical protein